MKRRMTLVALLSALSLLGARPDETPPQPVEPLPEIPAAGLLPDADREARLALCARVLEQRDELARRERELEQLERTLRSLQTEIMAQLAEIERREGGAGSKAAQAADRAPSPRPAAPAARKPAREKVRRNEADRVQAISRLLETMKPDVAATLAVKMPSKRLSAVLSAMPAKRAAKILGAMPTREAAKVLKHLGTSGTGGRR